MFHDVKTTPLRWNLLPEVFEKVLEIVKPYRNTVTLTVDDGGVGNYSYIYPVLEKNELQGMFFIPTSFINSSENRRPSYMNSTQIREISQSGHIIGSHSHSHPKNISLLSRAKVLEEWRTSKEILEDITGRAVTTCSIPGGFYNPAHLPLLKELGYKQIYNSSPRYVVTEKNGLHIFGRFSIENDTRLSDIKSIVRRDRTIQTYLYARHWASKSLHTLLHRIKS